MERVFVSLLLALSSALAVAGCDDGGTPADADADADSDGDADADADADTDADTDGPTECDDDVDCSDGQFCNGAEACRQGLCVDAAPPDCNDHDDCTFDSCSDEGAECAHQVRDVDGDGYPDALCGGTDCDDSDLEVHPDAEERCNGIDDDCEGTLGVEEDADRDGYASRECGGTDCADDDHWVHPGVEEACNAIDDDCDGYVPDDMDADGYPAEACGGDDCDDSDAAIHPDAPEGCDDVDNDCDGEVGWEADADLDGYTAVSCGGDDCDDGNAAIYPGAREECNGLDDDCDGSLSLEEDADQDDHGTPACGGDDCDEADAQIYPGAPERCNAIDDDCDWVIPDDADGDGHADEGCGGDDCNDADENVYPGAREWCNAIDDDCDGVIPEDADGDGFADDECGGDDCDDLAGAVFPGAEEQCNGVDDDCNTLIDEPPAVRIAGSQGTGVRPAVAWSGAGFGVVWVDSRDGNGEVYFARLSADGERVGSDLRVTEDRADSGEPAIVWTGSDYGVAWHDARGGGYGVYFARISRDGAKLGGDVRIDAGDADARSPSLAWTGAEYGVAWSDSRDGSTEIYFARVSVAGAKVGDDVRVTDATMESSAPSLVWTGAGYGVAWQDLRDMSYDVYFARLDAAGARTGAELNLTAVGDSQRPALVWTGTQYGVAWYETSFVGGESHEEIYLARVSDAGVKLGGDVRVSVTPSYGWYEPSPSLAWTGSEFVVAWPDQRDGDEEIYLARVSDAGVAVGDDIRFTSASGTSQAPALIFTGAELALAWQDSRNAGRDAPYFSRASAEGARIGDDARVPYVGNASEPAVAWSGTEHGVVFADDRTGANEIFFTRITAAGAIAGVEVQVTDAAGNSHAPSIAWSGTEYGVVWADDRDGNGEIYFTRLGAGGAEIGDDVRLTSSDAEQRDPAVAWTGTAWAVVWEDLRAARPALYFTSVSAAGVETGAEVMVADWMNWSGSPAAPALVSTGTELGAAWLGVDESMWDTAIQFARVSNAGARIGAVVNVYSDWDLEYVAVGLAWTGSEYVIAGRMGSFGSAELQLGRVSSAGALVGVFQITDFATEWESWSHQQSSVVWTGSELAVAFSRIDWSEWSDTLWLQRATAAGAAVGDPLRIRPTGTVATQPVLSWDGTSLGLAWQQSSVEVYFGLFCPL
jgi:hypothetical protein